MSRDELLILGAWLIHLILAVVAVWELAPELVAVVVAGCRCCSALLRLVYPGVTGGSKHSSRWTLTLIVDRLRGFPSLQFPSCETASSVVSRVGPLSLLRAAFGIGALSFRVSDRLRIASVEAVACSLRTHDRNSGSCNTSLKRSGRSST
jgi:hypothetical protein